MTSEEQTPLKTALRKALSELYSRDRDIERVLLEAGLEPARFNLNESAANDWMAVLDEASKQSGDIRAIVEVAYREYCRNDEIGELRRQVYAADEVPVPPDDPEVIQRKSRASIVAPEPVVVTETQPDRESKPKAPQVRADPPGWEEMFLGVLLRPAWLHERLERSVPEVLSEPFLAATNAPNGALPANYVPTTKRFLAALLAGVTLLAAAGALMSYLLTAALLYALLRFHLVRIDIPQLDHRGIMAGLIAGFVVGLVLGGAFGIQVGAASAIAAGVCLGVQYSQAPPIIAAIGWGTTLGLTLSLFPALVRGRHLRRYANMLVCTVMTVMYFMFSSLWAGHWGGGTLPVPPRSPLAEIIVATAVFFLTSTMASMRFAFNAVAVAVVGVVSPALTEPQALLRFMRPRLRYAEHFHIPLPLAAKALEFLKDPRNWEKDEEPLRDGENPYEEALANCRRSPGLSALAEDFANRDARKQPTA